MNFTQILKLILLSYGILNAFKVSAKTNVPKYVPGKITYTPIQTEYPKPKEKIIPIYSEHIPSRKIWKIPQSGIKYTDYFNDAEKQYNLPEGLLSRVAYQESHFRDDIITGKTVSSAGAIGLMQIIPKWHPDVNPYDPIASIYYAAKYLKQLYNRFNSWSYALAAYNWGPTNLANKGIENAPLETQKYYSTITKDIGIA